MIPLGRRSAVRRRLLNWYDRERRDLPWRRAGTDAFAQWVAEIMLQQTRVEAVIPYYERFMARFPTVAALARAAFDDVLKHWEGLGYYRRILHLHRAARQLASQGRAVPDTLEGLRALPGVGVYTAAAIASIAFGRPAAAVDGNVARVLTRLCGLHVDPQSSAGRRVVQQAADTLLPPDRPGDFNQAWMDLGSLVCTPTAPACPRCPLRTHCEAGRTGNADHLPVRAVARKPRKVRMVVALLSADGRVLVRRRDTGGLWSGLWEFPNAELKTGRSARAAVRALASQLGVKPTVEPVESATVRHELTHRSIRFEAFTVEVVAHDGRKCRNAVSEGLRWVDPRGLDRLAVSTAHRRVWEAVVQKSAAPPSRRTRVAARTPQQIAGDPARRTCSTAAPAPRAIGSATRLMMGGPEGRT